ncbi:MAG: HDIG domain-containing protein [Treponema sp.]|nr:HDIG domain-containing protein [Treponema sp.]
MAQKNSDLAGGKALLGKNNFWFSLKKSLPLAATCVLAYLAAALIALFGVSRDSTVASFALEEYEVGQIADRTIIADRGLPSTMEYPTVVREGEKIIRKGFPITEEMYRKLEKMANTREYIDYLAFGGTLIYLALVLVLWIFLYSPALLGRKPPLKEIITQIIFFLALYSATMFAHKLPFVVNSPYFLCIFIPSVLFVLLSAILFGEKSALFFSLISALGILNASSYEIKTFLFVLIVSVSCSRIVRKIENRIQMVFVAIITAFLNVVAAFVLKVIFNDAMADMPRLLSALAANGFLCGILAMGFLTLLEQVLNTASVFRLIDLSDLNNPLMQKMLLNASGTYSHSLMVAQLAENACKAIGANSLLARVGAYYHDIGKIDQSEYFVENQAGENKHDEINPALSVSIIRSHVKKGVEMARQMRLPPQIIDIIAEHHGNGVIGYFYAEALKKDPNANAEDFSYYGNPPSSKESGVVMIADTVEAACRTLEKPSVPRLEKFIQTLIDGKLQNHLLDNCALTFADLAKIKASFVSILAGYYHSRIEYPNQKDPDAEKEGESAAKKTEKAESGTKTKKGEKNGK